MVFELIRYMSRSGEICALVGQRDGMTRRPIEGRRDTRSDANK